MQLRFFLILLALGSCSGCIHMVAGPFQREIIDNRDSSSLTVAKIESPTLLKLNNGELVRIFGVQEPTDDDAKQQITSLMADLEVKDIGIEVILDGPTPAVRATIWHDSFICGNGLYSWNPNPRPWNRYWAEDLSLTILRKIENSCLIADLENPLANAEFVHLLRQTQPNSAENSKNTH